MSRTLLLRDLGSRIVRNEIVRDSLTEGYRIISGVSDSDSSNDGGILSFVGGLLKRGIKFIGWAVATTFKAIFFSATAAWRIITNTVGFIYNFNWNITDDEIEKQYESAKLAIAGSLGETFGNSFGYLACGVAPSAVIYSFNQALGTYLLKEVGEEALDELADNISNLILTSFRSLSRQLFYSSYKNIRKGLKAYYETAGEETKTFLRKFYGGNLDRAVEAWGESDSKPWSFRIWTENKIESIENPFLQEFAESFYDEAIDACIEAGYVVAGGIDSWLFEQQEGQDFNEGNDEIIEILPDRNAEEEIIIINNNSNDIRSDVTNAINHFQLFDNRDVGQIIGEPICDTIRKPPVSLTLRIYLRGTKSPPWIDANGNQAKRTQLSIPNVDKLKLNWSKIKRAAGGISGYMWGNFLVIANLDDGNKIVFFAGSKLEGERIVENLLDLTRANLTTLDIREETKDGSRQKYNKLFKTPTRVYPASMTLINQHQILRINDGIATSRGIVKRRRYLIPLYEENEPEEFNLIVQELSSRSE